MNGYERRKQKKIDQIYSAALSLFLKHGFHKVSVQEIAKKAKVCPATIYNYFGTKEKLYADMLIDWMDKRLEQCEQILASEIDFPEKTKQIMLLEAKSVKVLFDDTAVKPLGAEMDEWGNQLQQYSEEKVMPFYMKYIALGKQEGFIKKDMTEETSMLYFTMYKNELERYLSSAVTREQVDPHIDQLIELFFFGLVGRIKPIK
ncbi:TetR/AcrR family transcriptional regulator [Paenibacillus sp. SC116]|uniref:TetR/AcrR family transcriptional regulator n=1 Tax=Paenibacillus sp. SC116 TaxID=2968986 RepID=UPI00215AC16D|nr:TetR/AcrR family transcriptional regulator [Paenibacillus sp. SC116]MCR8842645.1 TetR/AcrR family transcriptional regulator [Paenibacillus sp. SC116]